MKLLIAALVPLAARAAACAPEPVLAKDVHRARSTAHTAERMGGASHDEIAAKINGFIDASAAPVQDCAAFSLDELNQLLRDMHCHLSDTLDELYDARDGRKRRLQALDEYEARWADEAAAVARDGSAAAPLRAAKCAEALMLWAHHVPAAAKEVLVEEQGVTLPMLEVYDERHAAHEDATVAEVYADSYTCQTGHGIAAASVNGSDHVFPHWPVEVYWDGAGQGPYPFWACRPCVGGVDPGNGGTIHTWWSEKHASEKFFHEVCHMTTVGCDSATCNGTNPMLAVAANASDDGAAPPPPADDGDWDDGDYPTTPCFHLMTGALGEAKGYLYTATEDWCCISTGQTEDLAPPQSDFMDKMTLTGTVNITTQFYSGEALLYNEELALSEAVANFWYVTTPDGRPLQQGEGGTDMNTDAGRGSFLYHEYDTFTATEHDPSVFDVPEVCKTTTNYCQFP